MSIAQKQSPPSAAVLGEPEIKIVLGVSIVPNASWPLRVIEQHGVLEAVLGSMGIASLAFAESLEAGLAAALQMSGVLAGDVAAVGVGTELHIEFTTCNRVEALAVVDALLARLTYGELFAVGWFDASEGAWRIVRNGISLESLEQFMSPARINRRIELMRSRLAEVQPFLAHLRSLVGNADDLPPS